MRSVLRISTLLASLLVAACALPGCSSDEGTAAKTDSGAMTTGKMGGGGMDKDKMGGAMDKDKMDGSMDKGKMGTGAMDKDKMGTGAMDKDKMGTGAMDKGKMGGASKN
jgi:hypothetical protein